MAKKEPTGNKKYQITVTANPDFCGLVQISRNV